MFEEPWYIDIFRWATYISTIVYPLSALAAIAFLFLVWRETKRVADHFAPRKNETDIQADVDVSEFVE